MANLKRGERPVSVNGRAFTVRITPNVVAEVEGYLGHSIFDLVKEGRNIQTREIRELFYRGVEGQHGVVSREQVGDIIYAHPEAWSDMMRACMEGVNDLFTYTVDDAGKPAAEAGTTSSA